MSTVIMSACWPLQGMSATQKAVLISLADNANDEGVCWPSVPKIAVRTCLSDRAVQAAIKWLCESNMLSVRSRNGRSTVYTITPEAYSPPNVVHPEAGSPRTVSEPKSEPSKNRKRTNDAFTVDQMLELKPVDLSEQTARDYFQFRKKGKGALNATIWNTVLTELDECRKAGIDADRALAEAMTAGWQGFKTDWLVNRLTKGAGARTGKPTAHTPLDQIDYEDGLELDEQGNYRIAGNAR